MVYMVFFAWSIAAISFGFTLLPIKHWQEKWITSRYPRILSHGRTVSGDDFVRF